MGKYVLVTGASSGIGYELAKLFAKNGYNLIITSRNELILQHVAGELSANGVKVEVIAKDLFDSKAAFELYHEIKAKGYDIEILVNDAGQGQYGEFIDTDITRELDIIHLNIDSLVVLTKCFIKDMVAKGSGKILNVSSIAQNFPDHTRLFITLPKLSCNRLLKPSVARLKIKGLQ